MTENEEKRIMMENGRLRNLSFEKRAIRHVISKVDGGYTYGEKSVLRNLMIMLVVVILGIIIVIVKNSGHERELKTPVLTDGQSTDSKCESTQLDYKCDSENLSVSNIYLNRFDKTCQVRMAIYCKGVSSFGKGDWFDPELNIYDSEGNDLGSHVIMFKGDYRGKKCINLILQFTDEEYEKQKDITVEVKSDKNNKKDYANANINIKLNAK